MRKNVPAWIFIAYGVSCAVLVATIGLVFHDWNFVVYLAPLAGIGVATVGLLLKRAVDRDSAWLLSAPLLLLIALLLRIAVEIWNAMYPRS